MNIKALTIKEKKDRIDELGVEIDRLKDARSKMLVDQLKSRDVLTEEYEANAKLVADALILGDTDKARELQRGLENRAADDAGIGGRIRAADIGLKERNEEQRELKKQVRYDHRHKADKLCSTELDGITKTALTALTDYVAITWIRTGMKPDINACVSLLRREDPKSFQQGVSTVRDKYIKQMEGL